MNNRTMSSTNTGEISSDTSDTSDEAAADAGDPMPRPGLRLWPHQDEAATATTKLLAEHPRAHLVSACGTGKTLTCAEIARRTGARRRLVVVPTLELAGQLLAEWRRLFGGRALGTITGVCSSEEVVRYHGDLDAEVTTSPDALATRAGHTTCTVISTYASLPIVAAAHASGLPAFDIAIADEAHRTVGPRTGRWTRIHDARQILAVKRLYTTATPRISDHHSVITMDDENVFGPRSFTLGFGEAIKRRLLAEYRFAASVVTDARIRELILSDPDDPTKLRIGEWLIPAQVAAAQIALLRAAAQWDLHSVITFHARRDDARLFAATLPDVAALLPASERPNRPIHATHVHGEHEPRVRTRRIDQLREPGDALNVVANVKILGEGVDVPAVDAVMFSAPTRSVVFAAQAVGRALRLSGNPDKIATIIVPVHLSQERVSQERAGLDLADEGWESLAEVAMALTAHDERLAAYLTEQRRQLGADRLHPGADPDELPGHEHADNGSAATGGAAWMEFVGEPPPPGFGNAVRVHAIRAATDSWEEYYGAACAYYAKNGNLLVPDRFVVGGLRLGKWIQNIRSGQRNCADWQRALLDEIGMAWNARDAIWEEWFNLAVEFKRQHGHLRIPRRHYIRSRNVGRWLSGQEAAYVRGKLDKQRAERLIELGMEIGGLKRQRQNQLETEWKDRIGRLRSWLKENPSCRQIPQNLVHGDIQIGKWWNNQTQRLAAGKLRPDQASGIQEIMNRHGLRVRKNKNWDQVFDLLKTWLETAGRQTVTSDLEIDGINIYKWLIYQLERLDNATLPEEREAKLRELVPTGNPHDLRPKQRSDQHEHYEAARRYAAEHGRLPRPRSNDPAPRGLDFRRWLTEQRRKARRSRLDSKLLAALNALDPGWLGTENAESAADQKN